MTTITPPRDTSSRSSEDDAAPPVKLRWAAPRLAYKTSWGWPHWALTITIAIAVVVGAVMDAQVMQPALAHILRGNGSHVAFICYVIGLFAALMMARAGWLLRGAVGDPRLRMREGATSAVLIAVWAAVGVMIAVARWQVQSIAAASTSVSYDGGAAAGTTAQGQSAHLAAVVFFGVYVATGVLALVDFYTARNDIFQQKLNAYARLRAARGALYEDEALLHRLAMNLTNATHTFAAIPTEAELAKASQEALVRRLKQEAVLRLGIANQSSAVMGVASTQHPLNPAASPPGDRR
jgi:hypothetical protein